MSRKAKGHWQGLLELVKTDDGLLTRDSGAWAGDKLFHWNRYIEITTRAMVGSPKWGGGINYVDLFCGPGVCRVRTSNERLPGSPLIAAYAPKPFTKILLCELNDSTADACEKRMDKSPAANHYKLFRGDCNDLVGEIATEIPDRGLTLAFLDPTGLHVHMSTVAMLSTRGAVDLLVLFPDAIDIMRNDEAYYFGNQESKLDQVLGKGSNWRERKQQLDNAEGLQLRKLYVKIYRDQLSALAGYKYFDELVIRGPSGPLYRLVYASKNEVGLKFWEESVKKELGGQAKLF